MPNPDFENISNEAAENYYKLCEGTGMNKETYYEAWSAIKDIRGDDLNGDGKNDPYTAMDKKLSYIRSLPIPYDQKVAMALASDISIENINKRAHW